MEREVALTEYFTAYITATTGGKVHIRVYANADSKDDKRYLYDEYEHADDTEEVGEVAQKAIDDARDWFSSYSDAINAAHLHMELLSTDGATVHYRLKPPGGHRIIVTGDIEYKGYTDTLGIVFRWYRGRGTYSPSIREVYTSKTGVSEVNASLNEEGARECIDNAIENWQNKIDKIENNETDADKIQEQLNELD